MDPQEGDIAEDGAGNFLVYRSGNWYPAQQDGRPVERIPRPDYGANHFQLPNGDIVRQGPRGGQETVENFGGAGGGALQQRRQRQQLRHLPRRQRAEVVEGGARAHANSARHERHSF